jgi:hypothetical protein
MRIPRGGMRIAIYALYGNRNGRSLNLSDRSQANLRGKSLRRLVHRIDGG